MIYHFIKGSATQATKSQLKPHHPLSPYPSILHFFSTLALHIWRHLSVQVPHPQIQLSKCSLPNHTPFTVEVHLQECTYNLFTHMYIHCHFHRFICIRRDLSKDSALSRHVHMWLIDEPMSCVHSSDGRRFSSGPHMASMLADLCTQLGFRAISLSVSPANDASLGEQSFTYEG